MLNANNTSKSITGSSIVAAVLCVAAAFFLCVLAANAQSPSVTVNWTASPSPNIAKYNVYRRTPTGTYALIGSAASAPLTDATVQAGATYLYVGTAVNGSGAESIYSNEVTAIIPGTAPPPSGLLSFFPSTFTPAHQGGDNLSVELGMKFSVSVPGSIIGLRFWKVGTSTGTHVGSLWSSTGTKLISGTYTNETASGWQTLTFPTPYSITAGATYTVSYHTVNGYAWDASYFATSKSVPPFTIPAAGGVWCYGTAICFPTSTYNASNYSVDVAFLPSAPVLTITMTSLPAGMVGAPYNATVTATGGTLPYTWTVTGLPPGLSGTSTISGTPTTAGTFNVSVAVRDSASVAHTATTVLPLVIALPPPPPPSLTETCVLQSPNVVCIYVPKNMPTGTVLTSTGSAGGVQAIASATLP